jgi:hypothetical protein
MFCTSGDPIAFLIFLPIVAVGLVSLFYHSLNTRNLEVYRDPTHWAGHAGFIYNCLRATYGVGYSMEGKKLWWRSGRFMLLTVVLLLLSLPLLGILVNQGIISGRCK